MKDWDEFKEYMRKVDYLVRMNPATVPPPLSQIGKPSRKPTYKYISKEKAKSALLKLPKEEVERQYTETIKRQIAQSEAEEKARWFNQKNYDADNDYWGKQAYWNAVDEGIILTLGKDPRKVNWENLKQYSLVSDFVKTVEERRELARRYIISGQLKESVTPGAFLAWAKRMGFVLPKDLLEVVEAHGIQIADWQTLYYDALKVASERKTQIELLVAKYDELKSDYTVLQENPFLMDEGSPDYAPELDAANIMYRTVVMNRDDNMTFKEQASAILNEQYSHFSEDAKDRIAKVINTKRGKHGGRKQSRQNKESSLTQ